MTKEEYGKRFVYVVSVLLISIVFPLVIYYNFNSEYTLPSFFVSYCEALCNTTIEPWVGSCVIAVLIVVCFINNSLEYKKDLYEKQNIDISDFSKTPDEFIQKLMSMCGSKIARKNTIYHSDEYARYIKAKDVEFISRDGTSVDYLYFEDPNILLCYADVCSTKNFIIKALSAQNCTFQSFNNNILYFTKDDLHIRIFYDFIFCQGIEICRGTMQSRFADKETESEESEMPYIKSEIIENEEVAE